MLLRFGGTDSRTFSTRLANWRETGPRADRIPVREGAPGIYHNTAASSRRTARWSGSIGRCTFPTIRSITRSSTSLRAIWDFAALDTTSANRNAASAGISGIRKERVSRRCRARIAVLSHGDRVASRGEREWGDAQYDAWRTIQRAHAIANGVYVAVVNRVGHETGNVRGNDSRGRWTRFLGRIISRGSLWRVIAGLARRRRSSDRRD